jgi:hypothetical protein
MFEQDTLILYFVGGFRASDYAGSGGHLYRGEKCQSGRAGRTPESGREAALRKVHYRDGVHRTWCGHGTGAEMK